MFALAIGTGDRDGEGIAGTAVGPGAQRREDRQTVRQGPIDGLATGWASTGSRPSIARSTPAKGGIDQNRLETAGRGRADNRRRWPRTVGLSKIDSSALARRVRPEDTNGDAADAAFSGVPQKAAARHASRCPVPKHGETEFVLEGRGYYRCKRCRIDAVTQRRRKVKAILVADAGGGCAVCGYDRHLRALEFHHLDPLEKRLEINAKGVALALDTLRAEARKCVLLCSNCHAEIEAGAATVPLQFRPAGSE